MPSYFYHLALELYPHPPNDPQRLRAKPLASAEDVYIPPPHSDIFATELPGHRISSWSGPEPTKKGHRRSNTVTSSSQAATSSEIQRPALARTASISSGDFRRRPVPDHIVSATHSLSEDTNAPKDWRFGRVSIQSIDMEGGSGADTGRHRGKSVGQNARPGGMAVRGAFVPSDPKNTEVGWGVVHLYRDAKETPGLYDDSSSGIDSDGAQGDEASSFDDSDCTTLCILAVPSYMTPSDFLGFVGEQTREDVSHFRLIRTARANKYMVLMKFREAKRAKTWQKNWNGKHFNSMEVCLFSDYQQW